MQNNPTLLKRIADYHLLYGLFCQEVGLWGGKTGMSIFFFLLSRHTGNRWYEEFAGELLDDVCSNLSLHCPVTFAEGLCGIGWAIEFLKKEGFIEGNTDEILEEVDRQVMERDVRRITDASLEIGLAGIAAYVRSRLDSNRKTSDCQPFDTEYLKELDLNCDRLNIDRCNSCYNVDVIWRKVLSAYLDDFEIGKNSWKEGVVLLSEQICPTNIESQIAREISVNSQRKTLLIFTEESNGASYGVGTYIKHLIQCFDLAEWDVNVIEMFKSNINLTFQSEKGVGYYGIPRINNEKYSLAVFYYLASRLADKTELYCHFNFFGRDELAFRFKESFNAHIVFTLHYMNWRFALDNNESRIKEILHSPNTEWEERIKKNFEKEKDFMLKYCDRIIAVSQHSYKTLHELYDISANKLSLVYNAVEYSHYRYPKTHEELRKKYGFKIDEKIILFVGRLEKNKGIFELISAFKDVLEQSLNVCLVIVGDGDLTECMQSAYPYNRFISYFGFIPKEQLQELYTIADIGIVPSYFEEFGYVAAEMMLNQCPIVINNTTGLKEITINGTFGITFDLDKNEKVLKDIIINVLMRKNYSYSLMKARDRILKAFTLEQFKENIEKVYAFENK